VETAVALGSIRSQMNVAGEVVRHSLLVLAIRQSCSESPNKRPV
jgi:hypothetical protein